jgi:hypothetical protein
MAGGSAYSGGPEARGSWRPRTLASTSTNVPAPPPLRPRRYAEPHEVLLPYQKLATKTSPGLKASASRYLDGDYRPGPEVDPVAVVQGQPDASG